MNSKRFLTVMMVMCIVSTLLNADQAATAFHKDEMGDFLFFTAFAFWMGYLSEWYIKKIKELK